MDHGHGNRMPVTKAWCATLKATRHDVPTIARLATGTSTGHAPTMPITSRRHRPVGDSR